MNVTAIIPAHLASVRFPGKILYKFHGLPMIEHVRRRALLSGSVNEVFVATCDDEIASTVEGFGGKVIRTSNSHTNGTSRIAEAVKDIECSHVILLQGDEPLLLPRHLVQMSDAIKANVHGSVWNATGPIENPEELDKHSFVKCSVSPENRIMYCFRRSPGYSDFHSQKKYVRKILGLIAFEKEFLLKLASLPASRVETYEFIEQMRIIENGYNIQSVPVFPSLPSVNEPEDATVILDYCESEIEQIEWLRQTLDFDLWKND